MLGLSLSALRVCIDDVGGALDHRPLHRLSWLMLPEQPLLLLLLLLPALESPLESVTVGGGKWKSLGREGQIWRYPDARWQPRTMCPGPASLQRCRLRLPPMCLRADGAASLLYGRIWGSLSPTCTGSPRSGLLPMEHADKTSHGVMNSALGVAIWKLPSVFMCALTHRRNASNNKVINLE